MVLSPGGEAMFDLGVYNVTTLTGLLGPARRVMAMSGIAIPERVVDGELIQSARDNAHLLLDFGMPATPWSRPGSRCSATRCPGSSSTAPRARSR